MSRLIALAVALTVLVAVPVAYAQNILFVNKSEGYEHDPVKLVDGKTYAGQVVQKLADSHGATFTETKNGSAISAENLKKYDLLMLYTSGDLTKPSKDGGDAMGPNGQQELIDWVKAGGAVMGFHSTTDSMHTPPTGEIQPFIKMLGAEFVSHGKQFDGNVVVVDQANPAVASIPADWKSHDEWYTFKNFNTDTVHVIALLDPREERANQEKYNIPSYPIIWASQWGQGKVLYNGLGHANEKWDDPMFQQLLVDSATWLLDENTSPSDLKPNYNEVVPKDVPKK